MTKIEDAFFVFNKHINNDNWETQDFYY